VATSICNSNAVLLPSIREGLPNVAVEAAACARAVIASDIGGLTEVVVNGKNGLLLPPADTKAWEAALVECARNPVALRRMGEQARQRVELCFDARHYPEQMFDLYEAALREPLNCPRRAVVDNYGMRLTR
jgi:glycosyltransferase involved in cell wall biosynthesis